MRPSYHAGSLCSAVFALSWNRTIGQSIHRPSLSSSIQKSFTGSGYVSSQTSKHLSNFRATSTRVPRKTSKPANFYLLLFKTLERLSNFSTLKILGMSLKFGACSPGCIKFQTSSCHCSGRETARRYAFWPFSVCFFTAWNTIGGFKAGACN